MQLKSLHFAVGGLSIVMLAESKLSLAAPSGVRILALSNLARLGRDCARGNKVAFKASSSQ